MSDSILRAAKKVAEASGLEWSEVHRYYRDLQQQPGRPISEEEVRLGTAPWLPLSVGKRRWGAQPNFVARLLIALAATPDATQAREAVQWTRRLTLNGEPWRARAVWAGNALEDAFAPFLQFPEVADDLRFIEVQPDLATVIFHTKEGAQVFRPEGEVAEPQQPARLIHWRGVISGEVLRRLSRSVAWKAPGEAPLGNAADTEAGDD